MLHCILYFKYKLVFPPNHSYTFLFILNSIECLEIHCNSARRRGRTSFSSVKYVHMSICLNRPVLSLAIRSFHLAVSFVLDDYGRSESECACFVFLYRRSWSPGNPGLDLPRSVTVDPVWYFTYCTSRIRSLHLLRNHATAGPLSIIDFDKPLIIALVPLSKTHSRWHRAVWKDVIANGCSVYGIRSVFSFMNTFRPRTNVTLLR